MWRAGVGQLRLVGLPNARNITDAFLNPCRYYSINIRPALYLYNSSTRAELFLMGVDHVTLKSAEIVQNLIKDVKPHVVAVELCEGRAKRLMAGQEKPEKLRLRDFLAIKGSFGQKLITSVIRNMHVDLACTGLKPGEETRLAIQQGKDVGAKIAFIDEDFEVIIQRAADNFSLKELYRYWKDHKELNGMYPNFFGALRYKDVTHCAEAMLKPEALKEAIEIGERFFPGLVLTIVHERNEHMVKKLREMKGSIVCIVGALHVTGMQKLWEQAERKFNQNRALPIVY
ncbi:hypothetical protein GOP47_0012699 [Adiantum capillus-veneris]|uniref:TraB family protein n=1 Tax=Adiantum capillus-veneris TaxID=13818 RepID=A0A9D4ZEJ9_ADICA|nr:hypothetical protein GOP47_0012699 [Adiantum capillus-veneris]